MDKKEVLKRLNKAKAKHDKNENEYAKKYKCYTKREFRPTVKYYSRLHMFKASNCWFNPETFEAQSYDWWVFVKKVKGKVVFNNYSYSPTTNGHQGIVRSLLRELGVKIDIEVSVNGGLQNLFDQGVIRLKYSQLFQNEIETKRGRKGTHAHSSRLYERKTLLKEIKYLTKLGVKFSKKEIAQVKAEVDQREQKRLAEVGEKKAFIKNAVNNAQLFQVA